MNHLKKLNTLKLPENFHVIKSIHAFLKLSKIVGADQLIHVRKRGLERERERERERGGGGLDRVINRVRKILNRGLEKG